MSKEEIYSYTRLLKFQKKRYGAGLFDFLFVSISIILIAALTIFLGQKSNSDGATLIFLMTGVFVVFLLLAFIDYLIGASIFQQNGLYFASFLVLLSVVITAVISIFSGTLFNEGEDADVLSFVAFVNYLWAAIVASYYLTTTTPNKEKREEMINKLREIREDVARLPLSSLGSIQAVQRGLKWIQFQQRKDGIWGENNPLIETSEVLRMFIHTGRGLNHSWKTIVDGREEVHTVEQTYYLILEALDTATIEPNYDMLTPLVTISDIDNQFIDISQEVYQEFKQSLDEYTEWEFVRDIERFDEKEDRSSEIPIIFPMSWIFQSIGDFDVAQKCADIMANTFGILINRSATRFNVQSEKEISTLILGLMYNTLIRLVRGKPEYVAAASENPREDLTLDDGTDLSAFTLPSMDIPDDDFSLPDVSLDDDEFSLPSLEDEVASEFTLPSTDFGASRSESSEAVGKRVKIGTSLASIRNFVRSKQLIDGSWSGRLLMTAECLTAVSDQESTENEFIKSGVHYILALQDKNGSWQDDIVLTSKILTILHQVNKSISLGGF
ncbi:MAG: hypothetical protein IH840_04480 [Candidatus Heimdallarchaeota archaeon]|nr:hypothetical protein [Candidatus Heimdallarchaeota archaeon]